jgi:hypothetical protein
VALQTGALYEGADFKIELIVYFLGHWFHFLYYDPWQHHGSIDAAAMKNPKEAVSCHRIEDCTSSRAIPKYFLKDIIKSACSSTEFGRKTHKIRVEISAHAFPP